MLELGEVVEERTVFLWASTNKTSAHSITPGLKQIIISVWIGVKEYSSYNESPSITETIEFNGILQSCLGVKAVEVSEIPHRANDLLDVSW